MDDAEKDLIRSRCRRFLSNHHTQRFRAHEVLTELAAAAPQDLVADHYGIGELIGSFEKEIASLLGKQAAVFMPSGTMAQQIALRIWADRKHTPRVAFHPKSHLELHEEKGYQVLHGLHGVLVGPANRLFGVSDLEKVAEPLAALLVELPQREIGGQLPSWDELGKVVAWARAHDVKLHLDGARLWECKPFYDKPYAEIAGLFDSVYVSFYKGLGGIAGAILAGDAWLVAEARIWQRRHGGTLVSLYPYVLAASAAMRTRLDRMSLYHERALVLAERLAALPGVDVLPRRPPTNMMHVYLRADRRPLERAVLAVAQDSGTWICKAIQPAAPPDLSYFELTVGDNTLELEVDEVVELISDLLRRAGAANSG
jgi:threonine aldolase